MKIRVGPDAYNGFLEIPAGDYWVTLNSDSGLIVLHAAGRDVKLKASCRRRRIKSKGTMVSFYSGGGNQWSVVVASEKYGEWVATVEYRAG